MEASLSYSGKINNFKALGEYKHNDRKSELNAYFNSVERIAGGAVLKTPISEAEFTRNLEKASFVTSFDSTADIVGKAALNLPGFNEIAIASSVSGGKRDFHSHTEVVFSGSKQYELDAALNTADVNFIDGSVNNAESLSTTVLWREVSSKKIEIALNLEKGQRKDLTFTLSTPVSRDIRVVMSHEGSFSNKRLSADVFMTPKEQLHVETDLDSAEKTTGSMLIRVAGNTFNALFGIIEAIFKS
ncbi:hypothetical protein KUTeg_015454 [Tegillarca granosa]|uniref:Uncharacterized protein n=1 Tax=Tegillarca granosa TaxID=220873 RepID=A0ABQ9EQD1_TEGGR|nr:hypothetical protein KUTeg_015454 [Tegillarca granosa]